MTPDTQSLIEAINNLADATIAGALILAIAFACVMFLHAVITSK